MDAAIRFWTVILSLGVCVLQGISTIDYSIWPSLEGIFPNLVASEQMYTDGAPPDDRSNLEEFDFIIVGAGAAGCALAARLSEKAQWKILLLESGGEESFVMDIPYFAYGSPVTDWQYLTAPQASGGCPLGPDGECPYPRGKVMGGSTTINFMIALRGHPKDYDKWAEMGNTGWDYDSVLPYFRKLENVQIPELKGSPYRGTKGPIIITTAYESIISNLTLEAAKRQGIPEVDSNGVNLNGISHLQTTIFEGLRWTANRGYLYNTHRPNLYIRRRATANKVIIKNGKAIGVEYVRYNTKRRAYAKNEVILSAGAVNSPKLLMLSGIGPRDHLKNLGIPVQRDLPVGRTLLDHTMTHALVITLNTTLVPNRFETLTDPVSVSRYFLNRTGFFSSPRSTETIRLMEIGDDAKSQSWVNTASVVISQPLVLTPGQTAFSEDFYEQFAAPLINTSCIQTLLILYRPKSKGTLELRDSNPQSQPIIDPNYFSVQEDVDVMIETVRETIELLTSGPFEELDAKVYDNPVPLCANISFGTDEYWGCAIKWGTTTIYHPAGTCRMGPKGDPNAVVNPELKVFGVRNLRVVDASIMPTLPVANLMLPTYMIAEKIADIIKKEYFGR